MVGHLLEYHPGVAKLKEIADSGELGDIHYIYSQPPQPREAARRRERAVVARRPRRLGRPAPRRRGAVRARRARRVLHAAGDRGRRLRLPALPLRPAPRTCTCPGSTRTRSGASRSSAPSGWRPSTTWTSSARSPSTTRASTRTPAPTASTSPARGTSGARRSRTASRCGSSASTSSSASARARTPLSDGASGLRVVRVLEGLQARLDATPEGAACSHLTARRG